MNTKDASDTIHEQDKAKRLQEEASILEKAHDLTNGSAGNQKMLGEVILWQVKESISHSTLLRVLIESQNKYQLKEVCELSHKPKKLSVRIFGVTYAAPVNVAIVVIAFFAYQYSKAQGWL